MQLPKAPLSKPSYWGTMNWGARATLSKSKEKRVQTEVSHKWNRRKCWEMLEKDSDLYQNYPLNSVPFFKVHRLVMWDWAMLSLSGGLQVFGDGMHWGFSENGAGRSKWRGELEIQMAFDEITFDSTVINPKLAHCSKSWAPSQVYYTLSVRNYWSLLSYS